MRKYFWMLFITVGCDTSTDANVHGTADRTFRARGELIWTDSLLGGDVQDALIVDSNVVLLDQAQGQLRALSLVDGRRMWIAGRKGAGPGEFASPVSLVWIAEGRFVVIDTRQGRASVFSSNGLPLEQLVGSATALDLHTGCATGDGMFLSVNMSRSQIVQVGRTGSIAREDSLVWPEAPMNEYALFRQGMFARARGGPCVLISTRGGYFAVLDSLPISQATFRPYLSKYAYPPKIGERNGQPVFAPAGTAAYWAVRDGGLLYILADGPGDSKAQLLDVYDVARGSYLFSIKLAHPAFIFDVSGDRLLVIDDTEGGSRASLYQLSAPGRK